MSYAFDLGDNASNVQRGLFVPTKILESDLLNVDPGSKLGSEAYQCFRYQQFCANLQVFLVNYVISTSSQYSVYA